MGDIADVGTGYVKEMLTQFGRYDHSAKALEGNKMLQWCPSKHLHSFGKLWNLKIYILKRRNNCVHAGPEGSLGSSSCCEAKMWVIHPRQRLKGPKNLAIKTAQRGH